MIGIDEFLKASGALILGIVIAAFLKFPVIAISIAIAYLVIQSKLEEEEPQESAMDKKREEAKRRFTNVR